MIPKGVAVGVVKQSLAIISTQDVTSVINSLSDLPGKAKKQPMTILGSGSLCSEVGTISVS